METLKKYLQFLIPYGTMGCLLRKITLFQPVLLLALLACPGYLAAGGSDVTAGAFASFPVSVRGAGMGGTYTAVVRRTGAAYHNPAWLGYADTRSAGLSYADLSSLGLVRNVYLEYVQPDKGYGASGIYWNWRGTTVEGPGGIGELGYAENTVCYALGKRLGDYLSAGVAVKGYFISTDIVDTGGKGAGLDLALYAEPDPFSTVGVVLRNALSRLSWDSGLSDGLPMEIDLGGSYLIVEGLLAAAELHFERGHYGSFGAGAEYEILPETFFIRGGVTRRFDRTTPSFGLGYQREVFRFDYAAEIDAGHAGIGTTHRVGMSLDF